jgi:hypothetical protein
LIVETRRVSIDTFKNIKGKFKIGQVLMNFDYKKQVRETIDASGIALEEVIEQQN